MNNDPSPTLPADPSFTPNRLHEGEDHPNSQNTSLSQRAKEGLTKKLQFLTHLSLNLDTLVYAELCTLYYMDCSFFRLFLRWTAQTLFVSPKTEDTVLIVPNYHVFAVVVPNLLCLFLHLVSSPNEAGEATRGYLHGGILVDFIGQKPPSSRFTLVLLDILVLALQCFMITVNIEKQRIRNVVKPPRTATNSGITLTVPITSQDHDAEERGVLRDAPDIDELNENDGSERGPSENRISGGPSDDEHGGGEEVSRLLGGSGPEMNSHYEGLTDILQSGNGILANFHIPQTLRTAWHSSPGSPESAAAYALQNVGYNATLAALAAQRRARLTATQQR